MVKIPDPPNITDPTVAWREGYDAGYQAGLAAGTAVSRQQLIQTGRNQYRQELIAKLPPAVNNPAEPT